MDTNTNNICSFDLIPLCVETKGKRKVEFGLILLPNECTSLINQCVLERAVSWLKMKRLENAMRGKQICHMLARAYSLPLSSAGTFAHQTKLSSVYTVLLPKGILPMDFSLLGEGGNI